MLFLSLEKKECQMRIVTFCEMLGIRGVTKRVEFFRIMLYRAERQFVAV